PGSRMPNDSGRPLSREWPFCSGPRQWIQSAEKAEGGRRRAQARPSIDSSWRVMAVSQVIAVCFRTASLFVYDPAGFQFEARQRINGDDFGAEEQFIAHGPAHGFRKCRAIGIGNGFNLDPQIRQWAAAIDD